ncbi:O-antigen ligase family protein [Halomonas sp. PGE1]|uniref:O-antigen ligase family protein n=1 Tax=Halomonas sp. PGE1 TaxID=2730360 RepID=UPI001473D7A6|nr:O-antigen ligase family protein [Halomonas sp. PGE1]QJQ99312.1 O-antigen ligase family protein [Halomonas sp. PGE1]
MALTGLVAVLVWGRGIRSTAPLWLLLAAVLVQLLSWSMMAWQHPEWVGSNPRLDRMAKWFLFIGLAWWLGGSTRHTLMFWGLALLGLMLVVSVGEYGIAHWRQAFDNPRFRPDFGVMNAQHPAMFFGATMLAGVSFAARCWRSGRWAWTRRLGWLSVMVVSLMVIVMTQTRGVWLSLLVAMTCMALAVLFWLAAHRRSRYAVRGLIIGLATVVVVGLLAGVSFRDTVERRLAQESGIISHTLKGEFDQIPYSSVGNRVHSWRAAVVWLAERPMVGWGDDARSLVVRNTEWLPDRTRQYGHLHNTTLEVLVAYGVLGLGVMIVLGAWVGIGTWRAWRAGLMPSDIAMFGAGFFIFFVLANQFESYLSFWTGSFLFNMVMGGLVTHIWRWQAETGQGVFRLLRRGRNEN